MKKILILILLSISYESFSSEISTLEFSSSYLTHHYSKLNADRFANQVSEDGRTINNRLYALTFSSKEIGSDTYSSFSIFGGQDSIGSPMHGFLFTGGFGEVNKTGLQIGAIWGMYFYDEDAWREKFHDRVAQTPSWLVATYGEQFNGINMVFGVELNLVLSLSDSVFIKFKNNFTPMLSNHSVGLGFSY